MSGTLGSGGTQNQNYMHNFFQEEGGPYIA